MPNIFLSPEDRASNVYASEALWNGRTTNEKEQMGRCADYLEIALKRCNFEVINAQYGNMYDRVSASNKWPADLHIALHTNGFNGKVAGTRVPTMPAVLPEFGFHDNPEEAQWLIDNMEAIAEETCKAVCAFFDVPYLAPDKQLDVEPEPVPDSGTIYRVQVGAFHKKENAEAYLQKVREVLPEAFIVVG